MKGSFITSKAMLASAGTALVMAVIGGSAAVAGSSSKQQPKQVAKAKAVVKQKAAPKQKLAPKAKPVGKKPAVAAPPANQQDPNRQDHAAERAAFAAALASKLGLTADQVTSALDAIRPAEGTRPDPTQFVPKLAAQLGKSEAEVQAALDALRASGTFHGPGMGGHRGGDHGGPGQMMHGLEMAAALATKLGVTTDQLHAALEAIRPAAGTRPDPAQFAAKLATQLGKTEADVKAALAAVRPAHGPDQGDGPHGWGHGPDGDGPDSPDGD